MTSPELVDKIKTKVKTGQDGLARDCCRDFFPLKPPSFQASVKKASLYVLLEKSATRLVKTVLTGSVSIVDPQKPSLERTLEISTGEGATDIEKACTFPNKKCLFNFSARQSATN